jgi:hypothetical protein
MREPTIPNKEPRDDLEKYGPETVRAILLHGWANRRDYSEVILQIAAQQSPERKPLLHGSNGKTCGMRVRTGSTFLPLSSRRSLLSWLG